MNKTVVSSSITHVLERLQAVKKSGRGYTARCPAHDDKENSLSITQEADGKILLHCFAGCSYQAISRALEGATPEPSSGAAIPSLPRKMATATVAGLAVAKELPEEFLRAQGLEDQPRGGVLIPYRDLQGKIAPRQRVRLAIIAKEGSRWTPGEGSLIPYGLHKLQEGRSAGAELFLVEGETDTLTLLFHGYHALGIPGASLTKTLEGQHLEGYSRLYIVQEPDDGGKTFVEGLRQRLCEFGWAGQACRLHLPDTKDINDFHRKFPQTFKEELEKAKRSAIPLRLKEPRDGLSSSPHPGWPEPLAPEAFHGVVGRVVRALEPYTEADVSALLLNFLVAVSSYLGTRPFFRIGGDKHPPRLFGILVGDSSKARKGSSWSMVRNFLEETLDGFDRLICGGLSTGEGLIWSVRDPIFRHEPIKEKGKVTGEYQDIETDPGVIDKRLLVVESELVRTLKVMSREANTLSAVLRDAWDNGNLRVMSKGEPARATAAHISILGHITIEELVRSLESTDTVNGFANRFLWMAVKRSKYLPEGGAPSATELEPLRKELRYELEAASKVGELTWQEDARKVWSGIYPRLSDGCAGFAGAILSRAEAQVIRLSLVYALLDGSCDVKLEHLYAALAVIDRVEASARYIFHSNTGSHLADRVLALILAEGVLTQSEIMRHLGNHQSGEKLSRELRLLQAEKKIRLEKESTAGRSATRWLPVTQENSDGVPGGYLGFAKEVALELGIAGPAAPAQSSATGVPQAPPLGAAGRTPPSILDGLI